ncbi:endonuclease/exonuclease/phosphatase family protein [Pseudactinotalea terrae]|uniref:endonuclease/exonuclease/phosphatase family protein n=1 Tax=Pseudactinotalea terrae TaxID=1743262 RepID=UPI0012E26EA6|nr:endonuclease/exonuclease/phosphatase family protein [Pseudactinotalea terrae]
MTATTPTLRCVTLNVLGPANPDWDRRSRVISDQLLALQADVVALQEVPTGAQLEELLGDGYVTTPFTESSDDGVGGVLATRAPHRVLTEIDQRTPENGRDLPWCATLVVEVESPIGPVVVAHHKPSWPFPLEVEREQQAQRAAAAVEQAAGNRPAIVLGDFDATPDSSSMRFWRGRRSLDGFSVCYQDAWETVRGEEPGLTFTTENPLVRAGEVATAISRRIDYVLVRAGSHGPLLEVKHCDRVLDQPVDGVWASDHFGVVADLTLPEHPPGSWGSYPHDAGT